MAHFLKSGNTYRVASNEAMDVRDKLPAGNYTIKVPPLGDMYLEHIEDFSIPSKVYGDCLKNTDRVITTFLSRPAATGVMLTGEKGSGKTLLTKNIAVELARQHDVPTIVINQPLCGENFNTFIQSIDQACIILFDEFEKVYSDNDQEAALTLLDGVFPSQKLFVLTCNDKWRINQHMRNRPGRIFYMIDFGGLEHEFIVEYCNDTLINKQYIEKVCAIAALFEQFNFDMLKALVEEMNRYNEAPADAMKMLNAKPEFNNKGNFDVQMFAKNRLITEAELETKVWHGNPLNGHVQVEFDTDPEGKLNDTDENTWFTSEFTPNELKTVEPQNGKFGYTNADGDQLVLTRRKETQYNYLAF
mgnify:CR=1 FL=1